MFFSSFGYSNNYINFNSLLFDCTYTNFFNLYILPSKLSKRLEFMISTIKHFIKKRYYVAAMRQLRRLNSVTRSPIFSHFGETLTGISSIRAYKVQNRFIESIERIVDENNQFFYPSIICKM